MLLTLIIFLNIKILGLILSLILIRDNATAAPGVAATANSSPTRVGGDRGY